MKRKQKINLPKGITLIQPDFKTKVFLSSSLKKKFSLKRGF